MRRITVSLSDDLDKQLVELRKDERYERYSFSKVIRMVLAQGLEVMKRSA